MNRRSLLVVVAVVSALACGRSGRTIGTGAPLPDAPPATAPPTPAPPPSVPSTPVPSPGAPPSATSADGGAMIFLAEADAGDTGMIVRFRALSPGGWSDLATWKRGGPVYGIWGQERLADGSWLLLLSTDHRPPTTLVRVDSRGNEVWSRDVTAEPVYGPRLSVDGRGRAHVLTTEAGDVDAVVLRTYDGDGRLVRTVSLAHDLVWDLGADEAGNVFAFRTAYPGHVDFVDKIGDDGRTLWRSDPLPVDGSGGVLVARDGGLFAVAVTLVARDPSTVTEAVVARYGAAGELQWYRQYHVSDAAEWMDGGPAAVTPDGGLVVAGVHAKAVDADRDVYVRKYSAAGAALWTATFGTPESDEPFALAVDAGGAVTLFWKAVSVEQERMFVAEIPPDGPVR